MRVIDHHDRTILLRKFAKTRQWTDIPIHREYAVADQQLLPGLVFHALQLFLCMRNVFVVEDQNLGPRQARSIDDR